MNSNDWGTGFVGEPVPFPPPNCRRVEPAGDEVDLRVFCSCVSTWLGEI
jgi:hypothetical protein